MFYKAIITIDPSQLTRIERVKPQKAFKRMLYILTSGSIADKEEQETFTAISILQQINAVFSSKGINNIVRGDMRGVQAAGIHNLVTGNTEGVQASGFANTAWGDIKGTQAAGFLNTAKGRVKGSQIAGFMNLAKEVKGIQIAKIFKISNSSIGKLNVSLISVSVLMQSKALKKFALCLLLLK